jgi:uncharacterized membrane protein
MFNFRYFTSALCLIACFFLLPLLVPLQTSFAGVLAHEGHHSLPLTSSALSSGVYKMGDSLAYWLHVLGRFHLIFLHFPIALIVMTVVAEWLWLWQEKVVFDHAARFMILGAAVFAPFTALLGFALSYDMPYEGLSLDLFQWHRYFGVLTAGLTVVTAILRERFSRELTNSLTAYYFCLFVLFICINLTGTFGGILAFGIEVW